MTHNFILLLVVALGSTIACAANVSQMVNGNDNVVINGANSTVFVAPLPANPATFKSEKDIATPLSKIERYLEATNPTELKLDNVKPENFVADNEEFLTVALTNGSGLPAQNVRISILGPVPVGRKQSPILMFSPSKTIPLQSIAHLSIQRGAHLELPVAAIPELISATSNQVPAGYDFVGVGLSPQPPADLIEQYLNTHVPSHSYSGNTTTASLGVLVKYDSIFGEKKQTLTGMYVYFGSYRPTKMSAPPNMAGY